MKTEQLKADGEYRAAGANAFENREGRNYGCHYGMKSSRAFAIREFQIGYDQAKQDAQTEKQNTV